MFQHFLSYLQFGTRFCGVEHTLKGDQNVLYATVLKKTKKEVTIDTCFSSKDIKEAAGKLPKKQHVFIVVNTEQVLTKSLKGEPSEGLHLVNKAFPNIDVSAFYYEIIQQGSKCFISICRKVYVDGLLNEYHDNNIHVLSFSLGNLMVSNSVPFIEKSSILTSNALITTRNSLIETIDFIEDHKEENYNVNGLEVSSLYLLSLSGALTSILNGYNPTISFQEKKNELINAFKQIRFFDQFSKVGLIFILSLLLVNFLFFNFYFKKVDVLHETSQLNLTSKERIIKLSESVNKAKKMTDDMLKSSVSKSSFFVNALIHSLPESILLSEINYQPLNKNIKADKGIELQNNVITVIGTSNNSILYSEWIANLEYMDWVERVEVLDYSDSKSISNLSIKISITP